jgi:prepilin-type N-terminal cleavage/methylation domain-containing protein
LNANQKGFTIVELGIVLVIIGILATIGISYLMSLSEEAHRGTIKSDLSAAYKAALGYYAENPGGEVDENILEEYGYRSSEKVILVVDDGSRDTLLITGAHPSVHGFYQVDRDGRIQQR